jgi:hypothetical protein
MIANSAVPVAEGTGHTASIVALYTGLTTCAEAERAGTPEVAAMVASLEGGVNVAVPEREEIGAVAAIVALLSLLGSV